MTLHDVASKHGISIQRVYKKIADAGIDVKTLKDGKNGVLTADGEAVINQLFNSKVKKLNQQENAVIQRQQMTIEKLENENSILKEQIKDLRQQIDDLRSSVSRLDNALTVANTLNQTLASRIPEKRKGIFGFLTGRTKKEE